MDSVRESVRVDRWLCAARVFKSRTQAHDACVGGRVKVNDDSVKPNHLLRVGDALRVQSPRGLLQLEVRAIAEKRLSAPLARELYEDRTPERPPDEMLGRAVRDRGAGRPTKRDRRDLQRIKRGED